MKVLITLIFISTIVNYSWSFEDLINCRYVSEEGNMILGRIYRCYVENNLYINSTEPPIIKSATGQHESGKSNSDLVGVMIYNRKTEYFPRGLAKIFPNLKSIDVCYGFLKEITQADLKPFRKLLNLDLDHNDIEVLEDGLFDFNPDLKLIWIGDNKISDISSNLFNNLNYLTSLQLYYNDCIHMGAFENRENVLQIIKYIQSNCKNSIYLKAKSKSRNQSLSVVLEEYSKFNEQLNNFTANFKEYKFLTFVLVKRQFEELKIN